MVDRREEWGDSFPPDDMGDIYPSPPLDDQIIESSRFKLFYAPNLLRSLGPDVFPVPRFIGGICFEYGMGSSLEAGGSNEIGREGVTEIVVFQPIVFSLLYKSEFKASILGPFLEEDEEFRKNEKTRAYDFRLKGEDGEDYALARLQSFFDPNITSSSIMWLASTEVSYWMQNVKESIRDTYFDLAFPGEKEDILNPLPENSETPSFFYPTFASDLSTLD